MMCIWECVSLYLDSVNITFGFLKIFLFSSYLCSMVFTWSSLFYFLGDLLKNIGKFVITLHSSNFQWLLPHSLEHSLPFYQIGPPSWGCPFISIQFFNVSFLIFFPLMFPCVPSLLIASFSISILSYWLSLSPQDSPNLYHNFLRGRNWTTWHMVTM